MIVGDHNAFRVNDETGTKRLDLAVGARGGSPIPVLEELVKVILKWRSFRYRRAWRAARARA